MAKRRPPNTIDIGVVKYIKDKDQNTLIQDENIKDRRREYFNEFFNGEQENVVGDTIITLLDENKEFMRRTQISDVDRALEENEAKEGGWARWYTF